MDYTNEVLARLSFSPDNPADQRWLEEMIDLGELASIPAHLCAEIIQQAAE